MPLIGLSLLLPEHLSHRVGAVVGLQDLVHLAGERAVGGLVDFDDGLHLAGPVVDGLPAAGGIGCQCGTGQHQQRQGQQRSLEDVAHVPSQGCGEPPCAVVELYQHSGQYGKKSPADAGLGK
jgi:hypothetical protein